MSRLARSTKDRLQLRKVKRNRAALADAYKIRRSLLDSSLRDESDSGQNSPLPPPPSLPPSAAAARIIDPRRNRRQVVSAPPGNRVDIYAITSSTISRRLFINRIDSSTARGIVRLLSANRLGSDIFFYRYTDTHGSAKKKHESTDDWPWFVMEH